MPESGTIETIPIVTGEDGIIRVSGTRVTLETIVFAFQDGATPEEIAQQYPSVPLPDIYQIIGYYLRHSADFEAYLDQRLRDSERVRAENERRWSPEGIRERLLSRRGARR